MLKFCLKKCTLYVGIYSTHMSNTLLGDEISASKEGCLDMWVWVLLCVKWDFSAQKLRVCIICECVLCAGDNGDFAMIISHVRGEWHPFRYRYLPLNRNMDIGNPNSQIAEVPIYPLDLKILIWKRKILLDILFRIKRELGACMWRSEGLTCPPLWTPDFAVWRPPWPRFDEPVRVWP